MQSKSAFVLIFLAFSWSGIRLSLAQQPPQCIAVITEINGEALLRRANKNEFIKAYWGTQLSPGDQIKTSDKSEAKLLFSNNSFISLGPNSMITVSGKESSATETLGDVKNISSAMMVNISGLTLKRDNKKDVGALAGLRSVNIEKTIQLRSPCNTIIKTNRPSFSWQTKKSYDKYIVNLYDSRGLLWSNKTSDSTMKYPENEKGLEFGVSYFWNVEGEDLVDNDKSLNHKFSVLTLEKSREVEQNETSIRSTFRNEPECSSLHSVLGAFYINQGLLQDAISEFQIISNINNEAPLPHEILGSLYSDSGDKDKAIEELQKALALSKNKDK
jgi:tetratricopeptide (TPR) repeat protein